MNTLYIKIKNLSLPLLITNLFILFFNALNRGFSHDEFEHIHGAWKIIKNEKIYIDFFQHHHGLIYNLLKPIILIFGDTTASIISSRIFFFILFLLTLYFVYKLSRIFLNSSKSLVAVLILSCCVAFVNSAFEIRPDVPMTLVALISIWSFLEFKNTNKNIHLYASALFLGIAFLFLQKTIFLCIAFGIIQIKDLFFREISLKKFFQYWIFFSISITPLFFYIIYNDIIEEYFIFNWWINMHWGNEFSVAGPLIRTILLNSILWLFFIIGTIDSLKRKKWGKKEDLIAICIILFCFLFSVKTPYRTYYLLMYPLMSIIATDSIFRYFKKHVITLRIIILFSLGPQLGILLMQSGLPGTLKYNEFAEGQILATPIIHNKYQLEKIDYVLSITDTNDLVYDGDIQFNLFRKDLDFFWYSIREKTGGLATFQKLKPYKYDIYELIEQKKPKVISNYKLDINNPLIFNNYKIDHLYDDLLIRK